MSKSPVGFTDIKSLQKSGSHPEPEMPGGANEFVRGADLIKGAEVKKAAGRNLGGRPRKAVKQDKYISVYLSQQDLDRLNAYCAERAMTASGLVKRLLLKEGVL